MNISSIREMNISGHEDSITPARTLLSLADQAPAALPLSVPSSKYCLYSSPLASSTTSAKDGSPKLHTTTTTVTHRKKSTKPKVTAKKSSRKTTEFSMKRYNNYNIFFMLERQRLLQSRGGAMAITVGGAATSTADVVTPAVEVDTNRPRPSAGNEENPTLPPRAGHTNLVLPALCRRYADLPLSRNNWFEELLAMRDSKRRHCKSHGLIPFADLARIIAANYREIDDQTKSFVNEVALRIATHNHELEESKEMKDCEDWMVLTQEQMKAQHEKEVSSKKKNDEPSKNINRAMSSIMMTQLPPRMVYSATMMPRPTLVTASFLPSSAMMSYDYELVRLRREAEMAAFARIELEQRITQLQLQHYHQLRLHEHAELRHIIHRENHLLTRSNNHTGIMSNIMGRGVSAVPFGASILSPEDNVDIQRRRISGVTPQVVNNDLLLKK